MRILFINTGPWGTGSFTLVKVLSKELLLLGHEVKIFFPDADSDSRDKEEYYSNPELYVIWKFPIQKKNVSIPSFPLMIPDTNPRNPNPITFKELSEEQLRVYEDELHRRLSHLIQTFKPDVIECQHIWYPCWMVYKMGLNYLVTAHHSDQKGFCFDRSMQEKAIACAQGAHRIVAISDFVKKEVIRLYGVHQDKIRVIINGYDQEVFKEKEVNKKSFLHQLGIDHKPQATYISFAGRISLTKGIDILIQANKLLDPALDIHFIVMGSGDIHSICAHLEKESYSLNHVHLVGQQIPEDVANIHNISKLSIMPSRSEGFGIAAIEAMACGLPLVVSRCGGPESFAVGEIVEAYSPHHLAKGIMNILSLPKHNYQTLRKQALEKAKQFSIHAIAQDHIALYQDMKKSN